MAFAARLCVLFGVVVVVVQPAFAHPNGDQEPQAAAGAHIHESGTQTASPTEASGTAWLPATTPMYAFHRQVRGWDLMAHGNGFAQFLLESGESHRRGHQFGSIN